MRSYSCPLRSYSWCKELHSIERALLCASAVPLGGCCIPGPAHLSVLRSSMPQTRHPWSRMASQMPHSKHRMGSLCQLEDQSWTANALSSCSLLPLDPACAMKSPPQHPAEGGKEVGCGCGLVAALGTRSELLSQSRGGCQLCPVRRDAPNHSY